jgi:hypothetical protein
MNQQATIGRRLGNRARSLPTANGLEAKGYDANGTSNLWYEHSIRMLPMGSNNLQTCKRYCPHRHRTADIRDDKPAERTRLSPIGFLRLLESFRKHCSLGIFKALR